MGGSKTKNKPYFHAVERLILFSRKLEIKGITSLNNECQVHNLRKKKRGLDCYVKFTLLYGSETWAISLQISFEYDDKVHPAASL